MFKILRSYELRKYQTKEIERCLFLKFDTESGALPLLGRFYEDTSTMILFYDTFRE